MNWYRIAFKKQAITQQDFFKFYALSAIPNEVFEKNPVFLFEFIEHLNNIRVYYLNYLLRDLGNELAHWNEFDVNLAIPEDIRKFMEKETLEYSYKFHNASAFSPEDFYMAKKLFTMVKWPKNYGGPLWREVVEWIQKLYNIGEIEPLEYDPFTMVYNLGRIEQASYSVGLMAQIKKVTFIIDMIHALEHNSNLVLVGLPQQEFTWLASALEAVKNVAHPVLLADFIQDGKISELYKRQVLMGEQVADEKGVMQKYQNEIDERKDVRDKCHYLNTKMPQEVYNLLTLTKDPNLMKAALSFYITAIDYLENNTVFLASINEIIGYFGRVRNFMAIENIVRRFPKLVDMGLIVNVYKKAPDLDWIRDLYHLFQDSEDRKYLLQELGDTITRLESNHDEFAEFF